MSTKAFPVARGRGGSKTAGGKIIKQEMMTPAELASLLRKAHEHPVAFTFEQYAAASKDERNGMKVAPWYCTARFSGKRRNKASLLDCGAVVLDADKAECTRESLFSALESLGVAYVAATSTSHGVGGQARYRVIIPLAEPVSAEAYSAVWSYLAGRLPGIDPGAKDASRLNYMPRVPLGAVGHEVVCVDDRPWFDAGGIPTLESEAETDDLGEQRTEIDEAQLKDLRAALMHPEMIEAGADREFWVGVGLSLLSLGATGFELFADYSRSAPNYTNNCELSWWRENLDQVPRSDFRHIFSLAAERGWKNPATHVSEGPVEFEAVPETDDSQLIPRPSKPELILSKKSVPISNVTNAYQALCSLPENDLKITYDTFFDRTFIQWPQERNRPLHDDDITRVQIGLQRIGLVSISDTSTRAAVIRYAREHPVDAVADYLNSLRWDGTRRLSTLLPKGFGTVANRYHIRAGRNLILSMVARGLNPACQVDEALIFEGPQGKLKSSALRVIGGEYFAELTANPSSTDFEQQLRGKWLGEFPELHAMRRVEDIARIKQFITCRVDHYRPSYGREVRDFPRRIVLCGSTNENDWLHDPTGGRRFIPIVVGDIDLNWLRENRDQLFAEAVALYKSGRKWWIYPRQETLEIQAERYTEDPWTERIRSYLCGRSEIQSPAEILDFLNIGSERQTKAMLTRVGITLRYLGCKQLSQRRIDGERKRPWTVHNKLASRPKVVLGMTDTDPDITDLLGENS